VTAADVEAVRATGLADEAISDAIHVCALFNVIDRIADSMGFEVPPADYFALQAKPFFEEGYTLGVSGMPSEDRGYLMALNRILPTDLQGLILDIVILARGAPPELDRILVGYLRGYDSTVDWARAPDLDRLAELRPDPEGVQWLEERLRALERRLRRRRRMQRVLLTPLRPIFRPRVVRFVRRHAEAERRRSASSDERDGLGR
jgi:hypothetical protein